MIKTFKVGLTGGIGSGKSTVLKLISKQKIPVLQTDLIGHELLKQKKIKNVLIRKFGKNIIGNDGNVDRQVLSGLVFNYPSNQKWLNQLLHPKIRKYVSAWIKKQQNHSFPLVVIEVPLLFERGYYRRFDGVLSVSAPAKLRLKRLLKSGRTKSEVLKREKYQWTQLQKDKKADWVIFNRKSLKDLKYCVDEWIKLLVQK
jgi:dephospho-CoA kinase